MLINVTDLDGKEHWVNPECISHINADFDASGPCYAVLMTRADVPIFLDPQQCFELIDAVNGL
jgi:hypothetical protein